MSDPRLTPCTAFEGSRRIASGTLGDLSAQLLPLIREGGAGAVLVFDDGTGAIIDLDPRDATGECPGSMAAPMPSGGGTEEPRGRGRPRLGVVPREVTLLPRHWDWLNRQPGGASVTLRKLVEEALRSGGERERIRRAQEGAHRFMTALAGDEAGFEEALRALYAGDGKAFRARAAGWPEDVRDYAWRLAAPAFEGLEERKGES